jgi:hypothetical protein
VAPSDTPARVAPGGGSNGLHPAVVTAAIEAAIDCDGDAQRAVFGPSPGVAQDGRLSLVRSKRL